MSHQNFETLLDCIKSDKNSQPLKEKIQQKINIINQIDDFPVEVQFKLQVGVYKIFDIDNLYKYLMNIKRIGQLYLNLYNQDNILYFDKCIVKEVKINMPFENYMEKIKNIKQNPIDENQLIEIISIYIIIHSVIMHHEKINEIKICVYCDNAYIDEECDVCDDKTDYSIKSYSSKDTQKQTSFDNFENDSEMNKFDESKKHQTESVKYKSLSINQDRFKTDKINEENSDRTTFKESNHHSYNAKARGDTDYKKDKKKEIQNIDKSSSESDKISKPMKESSKFAQKQTSFDNFKNDSEMTKFDESKKHQIESVKYKSLSINQDRYFKNEENSDRTTFKESNYHSYNAKASGDTDYKKDKKKDIQNIDKSSNVKSLGDDGSWSCSKCTFINEKSNLICKICGQFDGNKEKGTELQPDEISERERDIEPPANAVSVNNEQINDSDNCWTCGQCSYVNEKSTSVCKICFYIDETYRNEMKGIPEEMWRCNKCGTNNSFEVFKCQKCREIADFVDKWVCEQCSFYNDKLSTRCGACYTANSHLGKCRKCFVNLINKQNGDICSVCIEIDVVSSLSDRQQVRKHNVPQSVSVPGSGKANKNCKNCQCLLDKNDKFWCRKCEANKWFCPNGACDSINFKEEFCKKCKVKKGSDLSNCKAVWIYFQGKEKLCYQCGFCLQLVACNLHTCIHCKNPRDAPDRTKCQCGWNHKQTKFNCKKCKEKSSEKL